MIWFNNEILLELKDYIPRVKVAFLLTTDGLMKKTPEKETKKNKAFESYVKHKENYIFNRFSSAVLAKIHVIHCQTSNPANSYVID